jgi:hypothetical protein
MNLKEFVSETLQQIVQGVAHAQSQVEGDGEVNPHFWMAQRGDAAKLKILESNRGKWIHLVDFDVAVTVGESTETKGGIGLVVGPVVLGSRGQSNAENSSVSRIKFQVPIAYPESKPRDGA